MPGKTTVVPEGRPAYWGAAQLTVTSASVPRRVAAELASFAGWMERRSGSRFIICPAKSPSEVKEAETGVPRWGSTKVLGCAGCGGLRPPHPLLRSPREAAWSDGDGGEGGCASEE